MSIQKTHELVAIEHRALERWGQGDPSGYLEISAPDVVYFDPFVDYRIDGIEALGRYYEALRGTIHAENFEIIDPLVQEHGVMAVLTFNFRCRLASGAELRWNCTEVYRRQGAEWRLIQSHWSRTNPGSSAQ
jgi:ketosteroid isomerase-like protein